jgi:hypothetical protein
MKISKEKLARLRSAAGRRIKEAATGSRGAALQVIAGAVAGIAHYAAASRVDFVGKNWWTGPAIIGVAGVAANRSARLRGVSSALLGAAGYSAYVGYNVTHANAPVKQTQGLEEGPDVGLIAGGFSSYRAPYLDQPSVSSSPSAAEPVSAAVETIGLN